MAFTRREALRLLAAGPLAAAVQAPDTSHHGMTSRHVTAMPRGKLSGLPFHARFTDVGHAAGLTHPSVCGYPNRADYVIDAMGCGVAFLDYDNDGWLDLIVLSSTHSDDPHPDSSSRLYKNNRNGTFSDVTEKAGLLHTRYAFGLTVGDFNNDGFEDVFISAWPQNALYRNNGDGTFTDVTREAGLLTHESRFGSGCTFIDFDRDGKLDLFVSNYLAFDMKSIPKAGTSKECNAEGVFCGPRGLPYGQHSLYRNNGDGTFTDVSDHAGINKVDGGYGLTAVAADFDNDGWPDIYLACDSTPSLLFCNNHDGTFTEQALDRGVALSEDGMTQAGMGVGVGDLKPSGALDIIKTHFAADTPAVYSNNGKGEFRDDTLRSGLGIETRFVSWGVGIQDFDNNGLPDVFWVTGGIYPELKDKPGEPYVAPRIVFRNLGDSRFEELMAEAGPGIQALHCSRGCAFGDFDNDGDMDVLIMNVNEPPSLLRNDVTGKGHWIKVKLIGTKSNRSALGARVTVHYGDRLWVQEILAQSSYLSVNDPRLHFGLGSIAVVDIEVRWPSGIIDHLSKIAADQLVHITEGSGTTRTQKFT